MNRNIAPTARYALDVLLDSNSRLLMLKRSLDAKLGPGRWGLPAGKIEAGETPEAAAMREMAEEIGPGHEVELTRYVGPFRDTYYGGQFEIHLFQFNWTGGSIVLNHEHTEYAWVGRGEFRDYEVMDGIDEDIAILGIWPLQFLNAARLPAHLQRD
ncbi:MAG: NUDIX domain-containing protein [Gammaproteobacteria bacterium]|nr:NUDIX domain-containing protein [Gammaproteobacteria bacterium]